MPRDDDARRRGIMPPPVLIYYQAGITFSEAVDTERKDPSMPGKTINKGDISLQKIQNCNILHEYYSSLISPTKNGGQMLHNAAFSSKRP